MTIMRIPRERLLTEREVAILLNLSVGTIRRRRLQGKPPSFVKIGTSVRYRPKEVRLLIEAGAQRTQGTK